MNSGQHIYTRDCFGELELALWRVGTIETNNSIKQQHTYLQPRTLWNLRFECCNQFLNAEVPVLITF